MNRLTHSIIGRGILAGLLTMLGVGTAGAVIVPSDLPDLVFWVDAGDIDGNGLTDSLANGAAITTWNDKSSLDNDATQVTSANQPVLNLNALNGRPALAFDGSNDYLATASQIIQGTTGRTIFAVARADNTNTNEALLSLTSTAGGAAAPDASYYTLSGEIAVRLGGYQLFDSDLVDDDFSVLAVSNATGSDIAGIQGYLNGAALGVASQDTRSDVTINTRVSGESLIGASHPRNSFFDGQIAELIVYDRQLTPAEMSQVNGYLESKYYNIAVVPEPGSFLLWLMGGGLALLWRRRRA